MKYGLSMDGAIGLMESEEGFSLYSFVEAQEYYNLVQICHDFVESYLDANPIARTRWGTEGYRYFDILKLANPEYDNKVLEWSRDYRRRLEDYRKRTGR